MTSPGKVRTHNEDSLLVDEARGIFLLADGMGGHQAGEIASAIAVSQAYAYLREQGRQNGGPPSLSSAAQLDSVKNAILFAHRAIKEEANSAPHLRGMGTTLLIMLIKDDEAYISHVGDSRAYRIRDRIERLTKDHTAAIPPGLSGSIFQEHPHAERSHILSQAVGTPGGIVPETHQITLQEGDILLLCSDGLTDMLSETEIGEIVLSYSGEISEAASGLIEEANRKGGLDNISVVLVKV